MGNPMGPELKLVKRFDKDKDGVLNDAERAEARQAAKEQAGRRGGPRMGGPGGMMGANVGSPGPRVRKEDVRPLTAPLYDPATVRTVFLDFANIDWEAELADFYNTDVDVPATLTVDGKEYKGVGVHFRGQSSYFSVPAGNKRSLNVAVDFTNEKQRLLGYKTLNLLNSNGDPSMLSTILYSELARKRIAAPKANFVKLVINGESWGLYVNVEQFNNDFVVENFKDAQVKGKSGARWKVEGSPRGDGGLTYLGEDLEAYKQRYTIKSKDNTDDWNALIDLCRTLSETPTNQLESALSGKLDVNGALWFLALDCVLMNSDGYWTRASDYNLYRDPKGVFHVIPHDMNEAFRAGGGPGGPPGGFPPGGGVPSSGGQGGGGGEIGIQGGPPQGGFQGGPQPGMRGGYTLDLLVGMQDTRKPLRSKLLAVPTLRDRYLQYCRELAERDLNWEWLRGRVNYYRGLIDAEVKADTRRNFPYEAFVQATSGEGGRSLKAFAEGRRQYVLSYRVPR